MLKNTNVSKKKKKKKKKKNSFETITKIVTFNFIFTFSVIFFFNFLVSLKRSNQVVLPPINHIPKKPKKPDNNHGGDKDKKKHDSSSLFYLTFNKVKMVETDWFNMWLIDFYPFISRFLLVKGFEKLFNRKSEFMRYWFLGKPVDSGKDEGTNGKEMFVDKALSPVLFEFLSFFATDFFTDGIGYIIRGIFKKAISKLQWLKRVEKGLIDSQKNISTKLEQIAHKIGGLREIVTEFTRKNTFFTNKLEQVNDIIKKTEKLVEDGTKLTGKRESDKLTKVVEGYQKQLDEIWYPERKKWENEILENNKRLEDEIPKYQQEIDRLTREQQNYIADFHLINQRIIEYVELSNKNLWTKLSKYWGWFQKFVPNFFKWIKEKFQKVIWERLTNFFWTENRWMRFVFEYFFPFLKNKINSELLSKLFSKVVEKTKKFFSFLFQNLESMLYIYLSKSFNTIKPILPLLAYPFINIAYSKLFLDKI